MADLLVVNQGRTSQRAVNAQISAEQSQQVPFRQASRGELFGVGLLTPNQAAMVEDSYYTYANVGTRDTGLVMGASAGATYSATNALVVIVNNNPVGGPDVILDYFRIKVDAIAGGAPTFWQWYHVLDTGNRYSSGTGQVLGYNASGGTPPGVLVYNGVLVATAANAAAHDIGTNLVNNGASVAQAQFHIKFGATEAPTSGTFTTATTAVAQSMIYGPPVVIRPGWSYVLNEYWTGRTTTSLTAEFFAGLIVR